MTAKPRLYEGLGFPVYILNPKYIDFEGEKVLDVNPKKLMRSAFQAVIKKPARLSGAELRFLRRYMKLTQEELAERLCVERSSISKWESKELHSAEVNLGTEVLLRVECANFLSRKPSLDEDFLSSLRRSHDTGEPIAIEAA